MTIRTGIFLDWGSMDDYDVWTVFVSGDDVMIHREGVTGHHGSTQVNEKMTEAEFLEKFGDRHEGAEYRKFQAESGSGELS
uniref:hypothetical protein n=1 Tax=Parerythrobacter lutipelagi TaxID=1964208 RepID=UPI0010FA4FC9|nr:hypothetical protein [Parerythrobacter lutipelagi]